MQISLTIDNGPTPGVTAGVLDVLRDEGVPAWFFVLGAAVEEAGARALVERAVSEGHVVGNHTYSHMILGDRSTDQAAAITEIDKTEAMLDGLGAGRLFRPPAGGRLGPQMMSRTAYRHLQARDYTVALWNSVPEDWLDPVGWPEAALIDAARHDWTVTVIHDLPTGAMDQLGRFIAMVRKAGGTFANELPASVTPLVDGREIWSMSAYMTEL